MPLTIIFYDCEQCQRRFADIHQCIDHERYQHRTMIDQAVEADLLSSFEPEPQYLDNLVDRVKMEHDIAPSSNDINHVNKRKRKVPVQKQSSTETSRPESPDLNSILDLEMKMNSEEYLDAEPMPDPNENLINGLTEPLPEALLRQFTPTSKPKRKRKSAPVSQIINTHDRESILNDFARFCRPGTSTPNNGHTPASPASSAEISVGGYNCKVCGEAFRSYVSCWRHTQKIHKNIRYKCPYCDLLCIHGGDVGKHMKQKHLDLPYNTKLIAKIQFDDI